MARHNDTGRMGEEFAAATVQSSGYQILCRNFATTYGELDIVACKEDILAFIEVRTRRFGGGHPVETVTRSKRKRIISAAYIYLERHPSTLQPRFDIFTVTTGSSGQVADWAHFEGAFDGSEYDGSF